MKLKRYVKNILFLLPIILLLCISVLNMYGASFISSLYKYSLKRELIWIAISVLVFIIIYKIDIRLLKKYSFYLYGVGVCLLIGVLFFGRTINGSSAWFKFGNVSIQPSEIFKIFYLVFISWVASKEKKKLYLFLEILFITLIPVILIFLEPDTGVVIMYLLMATGIFLASPLPKKLFVIIAIIIFLLLAVFLFIYFKYSDVFVDLFGTSFFYRIDRLLSFTENTSFQLKQALIGIGSSGLMGLGLRSSKIYVPEITTDFVFSLTIMNFGFLGGLFIIFLYVILLINTFKIYVNSDNKFIKYFTLGFFISMSFEILEHIFMNLGLTPITGITLPFLSYGGSSLISFTMIYALLFKFKQEKGNNN